MKIALFTLIFAHSHLKSMLIPSMIVNSKPMTVNCPYVTKIGKNTQRHLSAVVAYLTIPTCKCTVSSILQLQPWVLDM